jgi:hypothetical protein
VISQVPNLKQANRAARLWPILHTLGLE